jgi:hypothetical protein
MDKQTFKLNNFVLLKKNLLNCMVFFIAFLSLKLANLLLNTLSLKLAKLYWGKKTVTDV